MEFQKNIGEKISFGFGSMKTAGAGQVSKAVPAPKGVRTKHDKKAIAKSAVKAAALTAVVLVKHKVKNRKSKNA